MINSQNTDLKELKRLVREGEGSHLEFKLKTTHPDKIMREVVAFANSEGGKLLVGVGDNGDLVGLKFPEEDRFVMSRAFVRYTEPVVSYTVKEVLLENQKPVLVYTVEKNADALVYYKPTEQEEDKKVYVRDADRSIQASREVREVLKQQLKQKNYRFQYGEKETLLMKYLDEKPSITVSEFSKLASVSSKQASKTLVLLVLANVLQIEPHEVEDRFSLLDEADATKV